MSFFDDASLVFLPSGQAGKDGKAYSMKPTNGDGDFTFSRGSNLTATRIDSNGLIEKGRENLLLQSNQFDTTWTLSSTSVTSGQAGYDGSNNAWLLNSTTTGFPRIAQNVTSSGVVTYSVYAKAATDGFILMRTFGADSSVWFDLTNGTIPNAAGSQYITSNIQSVGNGWYRCSVTFNGSLTSLRIYPASAYGVYSTSGNGVYIQDAQLEIGLTSTEYIESGASTGLAGILEDSPRFDYSGGASCPSLLLEPSRSNLVTSEYLGGNTSSGSISFTYNNSISPEGLANAPLVVSTSNSDRLQPSFAAINGLLSISLFVKHNGGDFITQLNTYNSGDSSLYGARFNVTSSSITITSYGSGYNDADYVDYGNGWYRIYAVCQSTSGTTYAQWRPTASGSSPFPSYPCYGFQVEQASYPTSYIPNHSGGSVTREADSCNTSYVTTQSSMTYYVEFKVDSVDEEQQVLHLYNSADQYGLGVTIDFNNSNSGVIGIRGRNQRTTTDFGVTSFSGLTANTNYKLAFVVDWSNETITNARLNGNTSDSVISARVTTINGLYLGSRADNYFISGNIGQFLVFSSALSVPEIITLTS